jgi:hypothetical protein
MGSAMSWHVSTCVSSPSSGSNSFYGEDLIEDEDRIISCDLICVFVAAVTFSPSCCLAIKDTDIDTN